MRIAIVGDLHLGKKVRLYPERDEDVLEGLRRIVHANKHVILAGDVFDTPKPPPGLYARLFDSLLFHDDGSVWALDGNHDLGLGGSALEMFDTFAAHEVGLRRVSTIKAMDYTGAGDRIDLVAWGMGNLLDPKREGAAKIVVGHGTHPESPHAPPIQTDVKGELFEYEGGEVVILGHLHHGHEFTDSLGRRVIYTGPFVQMAHGEGEPGYVEVEFDGKDRRVEWKPLNFIGRRFVRFEDWQGEQDAIVRAVVATEEEEKLARTALDLAGVERYEIVKRPRVELSEVSRAVIGGFATGGLVEAYVRYRKAHGREPAPEVIGLLRSIG